MTKIQPKRFRIPIPVSKQVEFINSKQRILGYNPQLFNPKIATIEDTSYSYRIINHWESLGLLPNERKQKNAWRRFNLEDLIWIHTIGELREFGFSIEKIKRVKDSLFKPIEYHPHKPTRLEMAVNNLIPFNKDSVFVIHSDGKTEIEREEYFEPKNIKTNFILIRLSNILEKVFQSEEISAIYDNPELNEEEISLLLLIKSGKCESITIHFNNGKIEKIDEVKNFGAIKESLEKIKALLKENDYQEIIVKKQQGSVVSIKQISKTMATL